MNTLYAWDISYFSGKIQAYLRFRNIPHRLIEPSWWQMTTLIYPNTGLMKVPVIHTDDDLWLADSTPIIEYFEEKLGPVLIPEDPVVRFLAFLLEDWADEWLWRPALLYRWLYEPDRSLYSYRITREVLGDLPLPHGLVEQIFLRRQDREYLRGDGITDENQANIEGIYLKTLDWMQSVLVRRPFILSDGPTVADFGLFASMFRHFSIDPTPARLMRERAPAVYEWVARLWNASADEDITHPTTFPSDLNDLLEDIGENYLPYLEKNARALEENADTFDFRMAPDSALLPNLPWVPYRVWCLQILRERFLSLDKHHRLEVEQRLGTDATRILSECDVDSGLYKDCEPPICKPKKVNAPELLRRYWTGTGFR